MNIQNAIAVGVYLDEESVRKYNEEVKKLNFTRLGSGVSSTDPIGVVFYDRPADSKVHKEFLGERIPLRVVGYWRDTYFEAFIVEFFQSENKEFSSYVKTFNKPVIVISTTGKKPRKTDISNLRFWPLEKPFLLNGSYYILTEKEKKNENK